MALADRDLNLVRRNSKSSNYSASIKETPHGDRHPDSVLSMLKTTTETGDIGSFSVASSRLPRLPNAIHRRQNKALAASTSRASSHYSRTGSRQGSVRSAKSYRSAHDAASDAGVPYNHRRFANSQDFPFPSSDTASFIGPDNGRSLTMTTGGLLDHPDRAYSLTHDVPLPRHAADNRSVNSLRSLGLSARPRSPYVQVSRFNPDYRPSSPALSDTTGAAYPRRHHGRPPPGLRSYMTTPHPSRFSPDMPPPPPPPPPHSASPGPRPYFKPSRPFDDLKRSFMHGNSPSPGSPHDPQEFYGRVSPPPRPFRRPDYGPPLPPAYSYAPAAVQPTYTPPLAQPSLPAVPHSAAPYAGFVQRVKNVLEERIGGDDVSIAEGRNSPAGSNNKSVKSAAGSLKGRFAPSVKDVDDAPVPSASEANNAIAAGVAPDSPTVKRLTRDLIKAGMDGMSDVAEVSDVGVDGQPDTELDFETPETGPQTDHLRSNDVKEVPGAFREDTPEPVAADTMLQDSDENRDAGGKEPEVDKSISFDFRLSMLKPPQHDETQEDECHAHSEKRTSLGQMRLCQVPDTGSARPFSMPHQAAAAHDHAQRGPSARSLPLPSHTYSASTLQDSDSEDDQRAIRLSTIRPTQPSAGPKSPMNNDLSEPLQEQNPQSSDEVETFGEAHVETSPSPIPDLSPSRQSGARLSNSEVHSLHIAAPYSSGGPSRTAARAPISALGGFDSARSVPSASRSGTLSMNQRASAIKNFHVPLPDLTEDSQEDASTTNLRMLGMRAPMFRPRLAPEARPSMRVSAEAAAPQKPPRSYLHLPFAETRNIPSFNFSRVDLTTKLNKALGYRLSRSFEDFTQGTIQSGDVSNEERPGSSTVARERYKSFFVFDESSEEGESEQPMDQTMEPGRAMTRSLPIDRDILTEIDRLSIPSVRHLTTRLSELLPNIKHSQSECDLDKVDDALKETLRDLRALGASEKLATVEPTEEESSAGKGSAAPTRRGTLASSASGCKPVKTRDRPLMHLMKDLPPLPHGDEEGKGAAGVERSAEGSLETVPEQTDHAPKLSMESMRGDDSELEGTAVDNTVSTIIHDLGKKVDETPKDQKGADARQEATPRPWNNQENYPWTNKTPPIKLHQPEPTSNGGSTATPAPAANDLGSDDALNIVRSMSPGFNDGNLVPVVPEEKSTPPSGKKGLLKSLGQIVGLKAKPERSGPLIDPHFLHPEDTHSQAHSQTSDRRVDQGDRYPTTSLIAPEGMQVDGIAQVDDGNRSFFSNDSSLSEHAPTGFRKRLTRFRTGRSAAHIEDSSMMTSRDGSRNGSRIGNRIESDHAHAGVRAVNEAGTGSDMHAGQAEATPQGMSKTEVRAKRLVEKLRHLLYKGGERLKNLATPKKRSRFWYETSASENMLHRRD